MPDVSTLLTAAIVGYVGVQLLRMGHFALVKDRAFAAGLYRDVLGQFSWWMVPVGLAHLVAVVTAWRVLAQVPGLDWGWYRMLTGEDGNALVGQTNEPGIGFVIASYAIPLLIVGFIPVLALAEERMFRWENERFSLPRRFLRAVQFGLIHCLVGVPLAMGFALTVSGLYFDAVYERARRRFEGVLARRHADADAAQGRSLPESGDPDHPSRLATHTAAAAHAVSNWIVMSFLLLGLALSAVLG